MSVYKAIAAVMHEMASDGISKNRRNQQQGYNFRGIDDVYNALSPVMAKHGLVVLPRVLGRECIERQTAKGGALFYVTVEVEFDFVASDDGSKHTVKTFGEAMDSADKATNKAMSAAYKYAAFQTFCIPTEGDNDADATTHHVAASKPSAAQQDGAYQSFESEHLPAMREAAMQGSQALAEAFGKLPKGPHKTAFWTAHQAALKAAAAKAEQTNEVAA